MQETQVAISAFVSEADHERLKKIAKEEGRSLTKQVAWVLHRYLVSHVDEDYQGV